MIKKGYLGYIGIASVPGMNDANIFELVAVEVVVSFELNYLISFVAFYDSI
ncbi:hypothetical protein MD588_22240 [Photobacterium sp. SDRW27]|uniref:hypothetical protein n=1 Tax=Photobacterium obscurum TaxID=2829490 RepID=UPI0022441D75|nr:hypothetical protein [Photobacterium obscurum]MCW8331520.1 hypothetical protein [Photobacterium obscurum]